MRVPGKPRRRELDFVRGLAILGVLADHFYKPLTGVSWIDSLYYPIRLIGRHGVDLFFVLSGFLVGGLLVAEYRATGEVKVRRFLLRRMFKIWPPYYFLLLFHIVLRRHAYSTFLWQNLFHVQNYAGTSLGPTWTLAIEEHFYLLLAFGLAWAATRKATPETLLAWCAGISVLAFVSRGITAWLGHLEAAKAYTNNRVDSLLAGVALAIVFHMWPEIYRKLASQTWALVAVFVVSVVAMPVLGETRLAASVGVSIYFLGGVALLILAMEHSGRVVNNAAYRLVAWIGVYSYAIYLWNTSVVELSKRLEPLVPHWAALPAIFGAQLLAACAIAFVTTRLIEWPFLRWRESIASLRDNKPLLKHPTPPAHSQSPTTV